MAAFTDEELAEFRSHMREVVSRTISDPEFDKMIHHSRNVLIEGLDGQVDWRSSGIAALWAAQNAFALAHAFTEQGRDDVGHAMASFGATLGALAEGLFTQGELPELVTTDIAED